MTEPAYVADRLGQMDDAYRSAVAPTGLAPDGNYQCVVDRFDIIEGKDGRLYLRTEMSVAVGEHAGAKESTLHALQDPQRMAFLKKHLQVLGCEPETLAHLQESLNQALDTPVLIAVKTKGEYRNVYVNQRLGDPIRKSDFTEADTFAGFPDAQPAAPQLTPKDDVPF